RSAAVQLFRRIVRPRLDRESPEPEDRQNRKVTMSTDAQRDAALALHRFGFGPRSGSIAAIAADPRGAVLAELDRPGAGRITHPNLLSRGEEARPAFYFRQELNEARRH